MIGVQLLPVDTWFFRDGTPFSAGDAPRADVASLFPPHPGTVVGALRAALAISRGWSGRGRWPQDICSVLGDGPDDLGRLSVDAPFLLRHSSPLFPSPRHLVGTGDNRRWTPSTFLHPGPPVVCDLGEAVRLPTFLSPAGDEGDLQPGDGHWLTMDGLNAALRGELPSPSDVLFSGDLWSMEIRTGLELDRATGTAKEGLLYSTRHVRPRDEVSIGARIRGLPEDWDPPYGRLMTLGGEGRMAECQNWDGNVGVDPPLSTIVSERRVAVIALAPLDLDEDVYLGRQPFSELGNATVVSACIDRPQRIGGWNSLVRRPLPQRSVLPAGSVLYCELQDPMQFERASKSGNGLIRIGRRKRWGFGLAAVGVWPRGNNGV